MYGLSGADESASVVQKKTDIGREREKGIATHTHRGRQRVRERVRERERERRERGRERGRDREQKVAEESRSKHRE